MSSRTILLILVATRMVLLNATSFYLPLYLGGLGLEGAWTGILLGVFAVTALFSAFQTGLLTDRAPIRYIAATGFSLMALFNLAIAYSTSPLVLLLVFFVGGLGNTLLEISLASFVLKTADQDRPGFSFGLYIGANGFAIATGMFMGGQLLSGIGYTPVFLGTAVLMLFAAALTSQLKGTTSSSSSLSEYTADLRSPRVLLLVIGFFLMSTHWGAEMTSLTPFLRDQFGLDEAGTGLFLGTAIIGLGSAGLAAGFAFDRGVSLAKIGVTAFLLSGLGHIAMTMVPVVPSWVIRVLHECGDGAAMVTMFLLVHRVFPRERVGGLAAVVTTATIVGRLVGSLGYAPLGDAYGYDWSLIVSGSLVVLAIVPLVPVLPKSKPEPILP
jgi:predicted MFS family arabinose efflux permease